jgi:hypothetical protein
MAEDGIGGGLLEVAVLSHLALFASKPIPENVRAVFESMVDHPQTRSYKPPVTTVLNH